MAFSRSENKGVLSVLDETSPRREFHFGEGQTTCVVGRSSDCDLPLPSDFLHGDVSRRHCRVEVRPSGVWVRDLGSLNGTYVNGLCIGGREFAPSREPGRRVRLQTGDEIGLGDTRLRVEVLAGVAEEGAVVDLPSVACAT
jgi:pSer/pThr/pTyr-binding forkhead associated (FHA) protein